MRLPADLSFKVEEDPTSGQEYISSFSNGTTFKIEAESNFYLGDVITSIQKATLQIAGNQALLYSTIGGMIGALLPISTKIDAYFFQHLEMYMRHEAPPIIGRDHLAYRSYYFPCRNVIDGDLCEMFSILRSDLQEKISEGFSKTTRDVIKKLEETRNKIF